jgi:cobalt-zinc-cadmium efflux system membrane fusion protein
VANLQLEFAEAEETTFEETIFSLGHIEVLPGKKAIVSSRIPGRAFSVLVIPHQEVDAMPRSPGWKAASRVIRRP